jgi:glutamine amidotransferase
MGWNRVTVVNPSPVMPDDDEQRYYFVHSYHVVCEDANDVVATAPYGVSITAAAQHGSALGVQFHPEKSHRFGMALLERFGALVGAR